jgi:hypothetical protein
MHAGTIANLPLGGPQVLSESSHITGLPLPILEPLQDNPLDENRV